MVSAGLIDQPKPSAPPLEEVVRRAPRAAGARPACRRAARCATRPSAAVHQLTHQRSVQAGLEAVAREAAKKLGPKLSVAMVLADAQTGEILGEVGSSDFFDASRSGWIDMTRMVRSPGSTLKPFIYGLAFEQGLVAQETLIEDRPTDFAGYRPRNFDMSYQGDVSVRQALQLSLNVPAVRLLDAVGPARLTARFRQVGVSPELPRTNRPVWRSGSAASASRCAISSSSTPAFPMAARSRRCRRHRAAAPRRPPAAPCSTPRRPGRSPTS